MEFSSLHFLLAYALVLVVPGPNTLAIAGQAALYGVRPVAPFALGLALGAAVLLCLAYLAASTVASAGCCQRAIAAAALLFIAWRIAYAARDEVVVCRSHMQFTAGLITAICNPVTIAFFVAQLLAAGPHQVAGVQLAIVACAVPLLAFGNAMLAAFVFSRPRIRRTVATYRTAFANVTAIALAALAIRLVMN